MVHLLIDDRLIEVPEGTKVIQAAERLGIHIPRLCFHPALGSVGACRLCAVKFLQGPFKGVQMSCMIACQEGMVVSTGDPEAVAFRRQVIEWLMLHHPHDCPVCDEGGHCLLQEMTVAGGHGRRRYAGPKRTFRDQELGPLVQHEMNRCIHCYRCARLYREYCGGRDLGTLSLGNRTWFGRYRDGVLESPFAGNLTEICPTGVFTDKPSRHRGRRWDFERRPSLCLSCSLGCHTMASARYREVVRIEARFSEAINGHFICDRGRYAYPYASLPARPRQGRVSDRQLPPAEALQAAAEALERIRQQHGGAAVALAGSPRASLETLAALWHLAATKGYRTPVAFARQTLALAAARTVTSLTPELRLSLREVEAADFALLLGADPMNEAPMLALALRQASRAGCCVAALDPRPLALPFNKIHLPLPPSRLAGGLAAIAGSGPLPEGLDPDAMTQLARLATTLAASRRPVFICGLEGGDLRLPRLAAETALRLRAAGQDARLFPLLPGANAFGAALLDRGAGSYDDLLTGIEAGAIRALVLAESDPFHFYPDRERLERALASLDLLLVLDYLPSRAAGTAHIFVPTATIFEAGGRWVNNEGRVQAAPAVFAGGTPVSQTGEGRHPPRLYDLGLPGGGVPAAWRALDHLATRGKRTAAETMVELHTFLTRLVPGLEALPPLADLAAEGWRSKGPAGKPPSAAEEPETVVAGLEALYVEQTFGTEELSGYAPPLVSLAPAPCLGLSDVTAGTLGLADGMAIEARAGGAGRLRATLRVNEKIAPGVLIVPRLAGLDWQALGPGKVALRPAAGSPFAGTAIGDAAATGGKAES